MTDQVGDVGMTDQVRDVAMTDQKGDVGMTAQDAAEYHDGKVLDGTHTVRVKGGYLKHTYIAMSDTYETVVVGRIDPDTQRMIRRYLHPETIVHLCSTT